MRICRVPMTRSILYRQRAPRDLAESVLVSNVKSTMRGRGVNRLTSGLACLCLLTGLAILAPFSNGNRRNTSQGRHQIFTNKNTPQIPFIPHISISKKFDQSIALKLPAMSHSAQIELKHHSPDTISQHSLTKLGKDA
ncbi:Opsin-1 [Trichinella pseudospiralis]